MSYRLNFTDTANNPRGIVVEDQSLNNTDTDLTFVGKNYPGYSQFIGENFLHLLENFARNTPPSNPITGQLWYDTGTLSTPVKPQLKVFDGTVWTEAGNIKKSVIRPSNQTSIVGDLWVDTTNQQLYLFTGNSWSLVGPQFSEVNLSGFKVEELFDRNDTLKTIITLVVNEERIAIVSRDEFIPKEVLTGFPAIRPGINLSTVATKKFWGTSEKADSLVVGNSTVPASNFLRSDVISTTNFPLNVRNRLGVNIGESLETSITSTDVGTVIRQKTANNRSIILQTTDASGSNDVLIVTGNKRVGVNINPQEALHVNGNILTNGSIRTTNVSETSIDTQGGVNIGGNLNVAGNRVTVAGEIESGSTIYPKLDKQIDLGKIDKRFKTIYADNIVANFTGSLEGNISGSAGSANSLTTPVPFSVTGDVATTQSVLFDGSQSSLSLNVAVNREIITNRIEYEEAPGPTSVNDYLLIFSDQQQQLRKIRKSRFLGGIGFVPVGTIVPFAGTVVPGGWLLCDGGEVSRNIYPTLFNVIGNTYKPTSLLIGSNTFGLPDLRGRFPLGRENMDNGNQVSSTTTATGVQRSPVFENNVFATFIINDSLVDKGPFVIGSTLSGTGLAGSLEAITINSITPNTPSSGFTTIVVRCSGQPADLPAATGLTVQSSSLVDAGGGLPTPSRVPAATSLSIAGGTSTSTVDVSNLPEHEHDMMGDAGTQFYAINDANTVPPDTGAFRSQGPSASDDAQFLPSSGGVKTTGSLGQPLSVINPFLTINYIIYAGN